MFVKEIIPVPHKIFKNIEEQETFLKSFNEACIIMLSKTDKDILKENYRPIPLINIDLRVSKKRNQTMYNRL